MKFLIYSDNHWSQYSSILRQRGEKYSIRLGNQIESINWAEELAQSCNCDYVFHLGDFFDAPTLNSEEITALKEINWSDIPHVFLVGNHEIGLRSLEFNSLNSLASVSNFSIIDSITNMSFDDFDVLLIPYTFESDRPKLSDYCKDNRKRIIFSHNDIKGIQMGKFVSVDGFDIEDINNHCDLFINGHLHNGEKINDKIINVGNLTGQNFSEDAFKYDHVALLLDTDDMSVAVFRNPYALNFYKLDFTEDCSIDTINRISESLGLNAILTVRCKEKDVSYLRKRFGNEPDIIVPHCCKVITSRFIIVPDVSDTNSTQIEDLVRVDHFQMFKDYMLENIGESDIVLSELQELCK